MIVANIESGLDITSIPLQSFTLSPGEGGGGGGGGVLVDQSGPRNTINDGEGYGGGRGWSHDAGAGPGLVLMKIKPKQ